MKRWIKYPSTMYLPFSPTISEKDKNNIFDLKNLVNKPFVITIKMDGSNLTMTRNHVGARNGWDAKHESFDLAKSEHAKISHRIPDNIQLFGEWLYAKHSIYYDNLKGYYQIFSAFDMESRDFLSWEDTKRLAEELGFLAVPVLYNGVLIENTDKLISDITEMAEHVINKFNHEGLVVKNNQTFNVNDFDKNVAKYVRPNHVQTDEHWSHQKIVRNKLNNVGK